MRFVLVNNYRALVHFVKGCRYHFYKLILEKEFIIIYLYVMYIYSGNYNFNTIKFSRTVTTQRGYILKYSEGVLDDPKTIVFNASFTTRDHVYDTVSGRQGIITKVWGKEEVIKYDNRVVVKVSFDYTVKPIKTSYNSFRVPESNLKYLVTDEEGNEMFLDPQN